MPSGDSNNPSKWFWRAVAAGVVVVGWMFILFHNGFHITPPVVFVCLGYFAAVAMIYNLVRTGVAVASAPNPANGEDETYADKLDDELADTD